MAPTISKKHHDDLLSVVERANGNEEYEVECVFAPSGGISSDTFTRVRKYLSRMDRFERIKGNDTLDVSMLGTNYRVSIGGLQSMIDFCNRGTLPGSFQIVEKMRDDDVPPIRITEYDIYFKTRLERPKKPEDIPDFFRAFDGAQKTFRTKKRYSFLYAGGRLRVDLTVVKASAQPARSMVASGVVKAAERFEIEIEYLNATRESPRKVVEEFFEVFQQIHQVIEDTEHLLTNSHKRAILCGYLFMVNRPVVQDCDKDASKLIRTRVMARPKSHFLSYQPVTLEQQNVLPPELGRLSVLKDYTVTEKADGERMLLYVDGNHDMYTIDATLTVRYTGVKHPEHKNTLLDGEFVRRSKYNTVLNTYMAFDVYFLDGRDVRSAPLIPDRADAMKGFAQRMPKRSQFAVKAKRYLHDGDIFELAKRVHEAEYDYHIDGLVFTPAKLGVGTYYKGERAGENTFGGVWPSVLKWKPPEENSIDMLVTYGKELFLPDMGRCVLADLQVAYQAGAYASVDPLTVLAGREVVHNSTIVPKTFVSAYLPIRDGDTKPRTSLGEIVYSNVIVEFSYDREAPEQRAWVPYRVRTDKTSLYGRTKSVANAANSYNTAMNVWRSIQLPVTQAMITGETRLDEADVLRENVYYSRHVSRARILSMPMLEFHNKGVKTRLFDLFKDKGFSLVDMASGKAGDMQKWVQARYTRVLGMDINLDNLLNAKDGAYKRLYQLNRRAKHRTDILFVQKDVSESWDDTSSIESEPMRDLYVAVTSKKVIGQTKAVRDSLARFKNALNERFDVVSCQFAIHYMFRSDVTLDTFCANVDRVLKKGGYFIGTCLNGAYVEALLGDRALVEGTTDDNTLWRVQRKFGDTERGARTTGRTVGVYLESINQVLDEYLVDFELLKERLAPYGIREMDPEDLAKLGIERSIGDFREWHSDEQFPMTSALKEYSFLNAWFVFKKY